MKSAPICIISSQDDTYVLRLLLEKGYAVTGTSRDTETNPFEGLLLSEPIQSFESIERALGPGRTCADPGRIARDLGSSPQCTVPDLASRLAQAQVQESNRDG